MKKIYLMLVLLTCSAILKAQEIAPLDFVHLYQFFQADGPRFAFDTNDYLMTVDKNWVGNAPDRSAQMDTYIWFYYKQKKTLQPSFGFIGGVMFKPDHSVDYKMITYRFASKPLWERYQKQMILMNATELRKLTDNGGLITQYAVNDLVFSLVEYPPGINDNVASYEVRLYKETNK